MRLMREPSWIGALLAGRYRLVREIERGGMGTVYESVREDTRERVAVKVLHPHLASDGVTLERFQREAHAATSLAHPNIVLVSDYHHRPPEPAFLVMEYLVGTALSAVLKSEAPLEPHRVARIGIQTLDALAAAHAAGIIHRDLKPGNIFLEQRPGGESVKLLDFGIAKLKESDGYRKLTATGAVVGTPAYMAPEQARGEELDARADVYAVGVIMYGALAGQIPHYDEHPGAMLRSILSTDAPALSTVAPGVPPELARIVDTALARNRDRRFPTARAMQHELSMWSSGVPSEQTREDRVTRPAVPTSMRGPTQRKRMRMSLVILVAMVVFAVLGAALGLAMHASTKLLGP